MPLVVAAEHLVLLAVLANQDQQMAISLLHVEDFDFDVRSGLSVDLEELAESILSHIARRRVPSSNWGERVDQPL